MIDKRKIYDYLLQIKVLNDLMLSTVCAKDVPDYRLNDIICDRMCEIDEYKNSIKEELKKFRENKSENNEKYKDNKIFPIDSWCETLEDFRTSEGFKELSIDEQIAYNKLIIAMLEFLNFQIKRS